MHLSEEQIAAFVSGALAPEQMHALEVHLQGCGDCLRLVGLSARTALRGSREQARAPGRAGDTRYLVLHELGSGSMGTVYAAYDTKLDRRVALKRIKGSPTEAHRKRLQREAQVMARLEHPHIAAVYDVGVDDEGDFISMQLVDGCSLRQWLREQPRSTDEVLRVFLAAGEGLAAAHAAGVTHRDFKPENVLIGKDGRARVTDFGLARSVPRERASPALAPGEPGPQRPIAESITGSGALVGTPLYMSPEQLQGSPDTDGRSDQFSFCVALFEALAGARPFEGRTLDEIRRAVASGTLPSRAQRSRVPSAVLKVLARGLAPRPEQRFATMELLVAKLKRARVARRRRIQALAAAAALAVLAAAAFGLERAPVERCAAPPSRWQTLWSQSIRAQASAAFQKTGLPFADASFRTVDEALGRFLASWSGQRREVCVQTYWRGAQSEALLARQLACLDRRLLDAEALANLFRSADEAVVSKAPQAVSSMLALSPCQDPPAWMAARDEGTAVSPARRSHGQRIAELHALRKAGGAAALLEKARALDQAYQQDPVMKGSVERAEALELLADAYQYAGQVKEARERYLEAIQAADLAGAEELRAEAELSLAWAHLVAADKKAAYESLGRASALLERIPESLPVRLQRLRLQASAANAEGRAGDGLALDRERLRLAEQEYGHDSLSAAEVRADFAMSLARGGHLDEARAQMLEVLPQLERHLGATHPTVGVHLRRLSEVELHLGMSSEMLAHAERALKILEPRFGTSHLEVGAAQYLVAVGHAELRHEPSLVAPAFARAGEILERVHGPVHPRVALVAFDEARYWAVRGDAGRAVPLFERACGMDERIDPAGIDVTFCWGTQAESYLDLGMPRKAGPILQKARSRFEKLGLLQSLEGLMLRASLARWHTEDGDPRRAARELEQVLRDLETLPSRPAANRAAFQLHLAEALLRAAPEGSARIAQLAGEAARVFEAQGPEALARRAEALRDRPQASKN